MTNTKRELKLSFSKNWNAWFSIVRVKVSEYSIWNLIDSFINIKFTSKQKFTKFNFDSQANTNFIEKHARYKIAFSKYKKKFQNWKKQKNFMTKIINHIYDITTITNLNFIQIIEIHSWNVLQALKARLTFFDSIKSLKLKQQYNRMTRKSINRQNIDVWLNDYLKMLTLVKQVKIAEIIDNKRAYRNFLHAIKKIVSIFVEVYELQLEVVVNHETQFIIIIDIFRHHMRMKKARKKREIIFNSTFVVDENEKSISNSNNNNRSNTFSFRDQQHEQSSCICDKSINMTTVITSTKRYVRKNEYWNQK